MKLASAPTRFAPARSRSTPASGIHRAAVKECPHANGSSLRYDPPTRQAEGNQGRRQFCCHLMDAAVRCGDLSVGTP